MCSKNTEKFSSDFFIVSSSIEVLKHLNYLNLSYLYINVYFSKETIIKFPEDIVRYG